MNTPEGVFHSIRRLHGLGTCHLAKEYLNTRMKIINFTNRRIFLLRCRSSQVTPKHISNNINNMYSLFTLEHPYMNEVDRMSRKISRFTLNMEIKITIWKLGKLQAQEIDLKRKLVSILSSHIYTKFYNLVNAKTDKHNSLIRTNNVKKFNTLVQTTAVISESFNPTNLRTTINQSIYNFTNVILPPYVIQCLELGNNYALPSTSHNTPIVTIIKDLEYILNSGVYEETTIENQRCQAVNIVYNFLNSQQHPVDKALQIKMKKTKNFLKQHDDVLISKADKGNSTVIMYREEYFSKLSEMLSDESVYKLLKKDPTLKYEKQTNLVLDNLYTLEVVTDSELKLYKRHNSVPPRLYGLRKTHKTGIHLRPVVDCTNSPTYNISKILHKLLVPVTTTFHFNVKNSFEVVHKLRTITLPKDYVLISLDIVSLFTNIPKNLVIYIINKQWSFYQHYFTIDKLTLLNLIEQCFDTSYFLFNEQYYQQLDGSAMGNPASPVLATIVVDYVINTALTKCDFSIPVLFVYVDDTVLAIPKDKTGEVLNIFNSIHNKIQFTCEKEVNQSIAFLDLLIERRDDNTLVTNWYRKPTNTTRMLNFNSSHSLKQKRAVIQGVLYRMFNLSHKNYWTENLLTITNIFKLNNYPVKFISQQIQLFKTKYQINCDNANDCDNRLCDILINGQKNEKDLDNSIRYFKFPQINYLTRKIAKCIESEHVKLACYNLHKTRVLYSKLKDPLPLERQTNVVYSIPCKDCDQQYVGQTRQLLGNRIKQHTYDCKPQCRTKKEKTALASHSFNNGHAFDFSNVKILDRESNYIKRNLSEMTFIKLNNNCVNHRSDVERLSLVYNGIINKWKSIQR